MNPSRGPLEQTGNGDALGVSARATRPPYDVDPRIPDDTWLGIPVTSDERPRSGVLILWVAAALMLLGLVGLWLAMGQR